MNLSAKQLTIGAVALIILSFGVAVAVVQLTDDDQVVARLTEAERLCNAWNTGASAAAGARAVRLTTHGADVAVFMLVDITTQQQQDLEAFIKARAEAKTVIYESQADAHRQFVELFADEPVIVEATKPDALPESFRVVLGSDESFEAFRDAVATRPGVTKVRDDRAVTPSETNVDGPLYLIKKQGFYVDAAGKRVPEPAGCTS